MTEQPQRVRRPKGLLIDYGGTLVEEGRFDLRADVTVDVVMARAKRVLAEVSERRDEFGVEAPWTSLTRLIHDYLGTRFRLSMAELEQGFWDASMATRPIPGAQAAGIPAVWLRPPNAVHSDAPEIAVSSWAELQKRFEEACLA